MNCKAGLQFGIVATLLLCLIAAAHVASAQVMTAPGTFQGHGRQGIPMQQVGPSQTPAASPEAAAPPAQPATSAAVPPSMLDQPAQPATVKVADGSLTIQAANSSLTDILRQVSAETGMTVAGLSKDQRIFGAYGPGSPREILSSLLEDTGYNILMYGRTSSGAPTQLNLSPRGAAIPAGPAIGARPVQQNQEEDDDNTPPQAEEAPPIPPPQPGQAPGPPGGPRTPQQMLQELQQMRQQQGPSAPQAPQL